MRKHNLTYILFSIDKFKSENKDKKIYIINRNLIANSGIEHRLWEFRLLNVPIDVTHLMLIGWLNFECIKPEHVWLIPLDKDSNKNSISITNTIKYLLKFRKFEITENIIGKKIEYDETGTIKYYQELANKDGFNNIKEWFKRKDETSYKLLPDNRSCSTYLGKIGEDISDSILIELFGDIERKIPLHGERYDRIVKGGYKIDIKVRCLRYKENHGWIGWSFEIDYNDKTDYFLLIGMDNLTDKNLMYIWLIHKNEIIRKEKFYRRASFNITNNEKYLVELKKYEVSNIIKDIEKYKEEFKNNLK